MSAPLVAHVVYRFAVGGLENGLVNLINHMPRDRYRHAVVCLSDFTDFRKRLHDETVQVLALHKREGKDFAVYRRLWKLLRGLKPAIVHTRNLATLDCVIPAWIAGVPHRIHGEHGWDVYDLHGQSRKYRWIRRACQPFVQRYVSVSQDLQRWLREDVGLPGAKLGQIYNGVDAARFRPREGGQEGFPRPGFLAPDSIVVGHVGRMEPVKDPLNLVRAFALLPEAAPQVCERLRLVMVGDGPLRAQALGILESSGLAKQAWLPGSRDDVPELLRCFDVFALPSLNEGISNTILEAMASGLPVVATEVGGNPELVLQGETGLLVPPADPPALARALATYASGEEARTRHGEAARRRVLERFALEVMVRHYVKLYDSVLGRGDESDFQRED